MKVIVINGSPKGDDGITLQYARFIKKNFKTHSFDYINAGHDINKIKLDAEYREQIFGRIKEADAVIWCTPVYFMLVPAQLVNFIEIIFEKGYDKIFEGKYATAITTSVHFYDHTSHNYLNAISEDLRMSYFKGYSAKMEDLLEEPERENFKNYAAEFLRTADDKLPCESVFEPIINNPGFIYMPAEIKDVNKKEDKKAVIIYDYKGEDDNLKRMVDTYAKLSPYPVDILKLKDFNIKGGCLGCIMCGYDGTCVYKDDFQEIYKDKITPADIIIFAGSIKHRYLSSDYKYFLNRSFFNGHRPLMQNKQMGYIISGPLRKNPNLRQMLEAMAEVSGGNFAGIITDEFNNSSKLTDYIGAYAQRAARAIEAKFTYPESYLGVGGHLIFRDLIYKTKSIFKEDYSFYKKHNLMDYPQKDFSGKLRNAFISTLFALPSMRKKFYKKIKEEMVKPYKKILA